MNKLLKCLGRRLLYHRISLQNLTLWQWRTQGGGVRVFNPPPRNSEGPPKNRAKLNQIVKLLKKKLLKLGRQHTKFFGKKGSNILKLRRFAIVLH